MGPMIYRSQCLAHIETRLYTRPKQNCNLRDTDFDKITHVPYAISFFFQRYIATTNQCVLNHLLNCLFIVLSFNHRWVNLTHYVQMVYVGDIAISVPFKLKL